MTVIPNNFAQANLLFGGAQYPSGAQVTIGLDVIAGSATPAIAANALIANYLANIQDQMSSSTVLTGVLVKFGPELTGPSALVGANIQGTGGSNGISSNVSYLVRKLTSLGGRAGRGRMYWPGPTEADVNEAGTVLGARVTSLQAALNDFLTQMVADGDGPVLLHGVGSPISTPTPITSFSLDTRVATQRRRLRR